MTVQGAATLRERAYGSFTRHLLARELRAGQFISQRELVELTGLTLAAIRELIPRLECEGLIRTVPKRGMQIAHVDLNLIRDAFQFRLFLEQDAVALFARGENAAAVADLRRQHDEIIADCREAEARGGVPAALLERAQAVDWRLHENVIDSLGNKIIAEAYRVNAIKIRLIRQEQTLLNDSVVVSSMMEHVRILEALAAHDPAAAATAMGKHIENACRRALEQR